MYTYIGFVAARGQQPAEFTYDVHRYARSQIEDTKQQ